MITLANPGWAGPALGLLAVGALVTFLSYRRTGHWGAAGLKLLAFTLVALCLVEPSWSTERARPGANVLAVVVDASRSMRLAGRDDLVRETLKGSWLNKLGGSFQLRRYLFDARLRRSSDFTDLTFDGEASDLGSALSELADRNRGAPLAGIVVLSDGNATDVPRPAGLPPVHVVAISGRAAPPDLSLAEVAVTETAFEDAPVTVLARVEASDHARSQARVELLDAAGVVVKSEPLSFTKDEESVSVRLRFKPPKPGVAFYTVRVTGAKDEATLANNTRVAMVRRPRGPYRVLYVGGRPDWELKFLRRAMDDDAEVQLVGLVRIAHREPRFAFRGRSGESSNPLFRGFGRPDDEAERHDQPVLVRMGTRDDAELRDGFPTTPDGLYGFHALVLDGVEAGFFTADQQTLVEHFVTERGGGLAMLGGPGSFRHGHYERTPIGQVLPVHLEAAAGAAPAGRLELTREGWLEPWLRLRDNEAAERQRLETTPPFRFVNRVGDPKPGATMLATLRPDKGDPLPAIVSHRVGAGRAVAITIGDLWRWGLRSPQAGADLGKLWRQTVRYLVSDVPERVAVRVAGKQVSVRVRDSAYKAADDAQVTLELTAPDGRKTSLPAEPSAAERGLYDVQLASTGSGGHHIAVKVTRPGEPKPLEAESGFVNDRDADEHRTVRANPEALAALAAATGGEVITDLDRFAERLPARKAPVSDTETRPLWSLWPMFAAAMAAFLGEWWLRRTRGLT